MKFQQIRTLALSAILSIASTGTYAATEIQWWHAMGGALGETVNDIAAGFNNSQ